MMWDQVRSSQVRWLRPLPTALPFAKGRDFAAWLGLVPKQMSTGDRTILGHISKRGNRYLRALGARVILLRPTNWARHSFGPWLTANRTARVPVKNMPSKVPATSDFQMAEVAIARQMFQEILRLIAEYGRSHHQR